MKTILTVIGARPQFIKAAVLSRLIRTNPWDQRFREILLHTGQHYDDNMSDLFFREMQIPPPDIHLNIGGGSHGQMTGRMLAEIETILLREKPDMLLVYGDTNSTLAGALAASKLHIPVAHVESGLRSYNKRMPEEQNRILTDHLATWLFCPTQVSVDNLERENVTAGVSRVGDIMYDATLFYRAMLESGSITAESALPGNLPAGGFILATVHRAENTDDPARLTQIVEAFNTCGQPVVLPLHPRTKKQLSLFGLSFSSNVTVIDPVGYLDMIRLESRCRCIVTDSGGVQKEAYFMHKPCITLRDETEWVETVHSGWNTLTGASATAIHRALENTAIPELHPDFYGDGNTGSRILEIL